MASALWHTLDPMIGGAATRAVFVRAWTLLQRRYPWAGDAAVVTGGLDAGHLRVHLRAKDPASARQLLGGFVDESYLVLHRLLGKALLPLLQEAQAELAARKARAEGSPLADEEGR